MVNERSVEKRKGPVAGGKPLVERKGEEKRAPESLYLGEYVGKKVTQRKRTCAEP